MGEDLSVNFIQKGLRVVRVYDEIEEDFLNSSLTNTERVFLVLRISASSLKREKILIFSKSSKVCDTNDSSTPYC
ncbi:unnamed protein product [Colias eurytheme]|nr:unnamed protein product [Colias eurytheme]